MRFTITTALLLVLSAWPARAQSVAENLPPVLLPEEGGQVDRVLPKEPALPSHTFTVSDVGVDVTAESASKARDKAIMEAERAAYTQLCARLGVPDGAEKLNDDEIAALVQSFEVQSERVSAVRYVGTFTILFNPTALKKRISLPPALPQSLSETTAVEVNQLPAQAESRGALLHLTVAVKANTLAQWTQIKKRLGSIPQVSSIDTLDVGRGLIHIDLSYNGSFEELKRATLTQGLVLRQEVTGVLELYDGSMVFR
jgi:hypothetical protein